MTGKSSREGKKPISVWVPEDEFHVLDDYCAKTAQSKTIVIRQFIKKIQDTGNKPEGHPIAFSSLLSDVPGLSFDMPSGETFT